MEPMATQPANVSVDPLESLNAPAQVAEPTQVPYPEEGVVTQQPVAALPPKETPQGGGGGGPAEEPKTFNWDSDDNPFKAQVTELSQTLETFKPVLEQLSAAREAQKAKAIEEIANKVEQASIESAAPLSNEEKEAVKTAITGYVEYKKQEPVIFQERLIGSAINYAGQLLGDNATIGDLKRTAAQLMQKYPTIQGMEAYVAARREYQQELTATQRAQAAVQRASSGVDNVAAAPPQSGAMSTLKDYEVAIYRGVKLSDKQWANYMALREQRGL